LNEWRQQNVNGRDISVKRRFALLPGHDVIRAIASRYAILSAVADLQLIDRLPGGFRNRVFRLVGICAGAGAGAAAALREWILVTPAAAT
jgi:hypothetical protein